MKGRRLMIGLLSGLVACTVGCQPRRASPIRFEEVASRSGIDFTHFGTNRHSLLPEDVGSGCGWGDFDQDGDDDLFLVNFAGRLLTPAAELQRRPGNRLYRNDGGGRFTDVTAAAGLVRSGHDNACLWWDFDGDGWPDLAVSHYEGLVLYRNQGNGAFKDATAASGLGQVQRYVMGLCAADYDRDGDLDLYACGYVRFPTAKAVDRPLVAGRPAVWTSPVSYPPEDNALLRNNGDGTFTDVTQEAGVADPQGKSMMAVFADFDNDRWPDIYVGNDQSTADSLFRNLGNGSFTNVAALAGTLDYRAGMGIAVADVWHRGWLDLLVTHWVAEDLALWRNVTGDYQSKMPMAFDDVTPRVGLTPKPTPLVGWGCGLFDFDNDGGLDFLLVNGSTIEDELTREVLTDPKLLPQTAQVFRWEPASQRFQEQTRSAGGFFHRHQIGRGLAFADFDQDGRVDAAVNVNNGPAALLRNTSTSGNWLRVRAVGAPKNRFAIGARIAVHAGGHTQSRPVLCGSSYLSTDSLVAPFGLGMSERADWVEVRFPGGAVRRQTNVTANQLIVINE
jgi:hypothetical protein